MHAGEGSRLPAGREAGLVAIVAVALCLPGIVNGPGPLADDWVFLRNARFDGWLHAAGPRQSGRPGGAVVYDLTFGLVGNHPLVLAIVQAALLAIAAVTLLAALRVFVSPRLAWVATLVWLVAPNHSSLEHWFSTAQALMSLTFLCVGARALALAVERERNRIPAYLALAVAIACYELAAAACVVVIVAVPWVVARHRPSARQVAIGWLVIGIPIAWALTHRTVYARAEGWLDPTLVLPGNLSLGLAGYGAQGRLVTGVGLAVVLVAVVRLRNAGWAEMRDSERLVLAGAAVLVLGVLPVARFPTNFLGLDDRLTVVSGVGAAMVWAGGAWAACEAIGRARARVLGPALVVMLAAIVVPVRWQRERDYRDAADMALAETKRLIALTNDQPVVDVPGAIANADRIYGLNDGWNATAAVQALSGDAQRVVLTDGIGPDPADPTQAFR